MPVPIPQSSTGPDGNSYTYSYPAYGFVYLPFPITIGNGSGSQGVAFANLSEPPVLPEFTSERKIIIHEMASPGLSQRGNRVIEVYQTSKSTYPNWWDFEFKADLITPDQLARIRGWSDGSVNSTDPGYVILTPGSVNSPTAFYLGMMASDPKPENYRYNGRLFHRVQIKIHVLGVSSVSSISIT